jgi:hypothetical protein
MVKAFPPVVRFSGLSFSYNVAYAIFGGLTPMVVSCCSRKPDGAGLLCGGAVASGLWWRLSLEAGADPAVLCGCNASSGPATNA